ncbi:MAG: putative 30,6 kDa protein in fumA 3region [Peptococcaceae bacterium]|jgi:peptidoglycan-N-acetylmuramic acid deacetylase|nr:putative 30,6 kDa protein in fumA 3region [Peptococcaceae bacterium]
MAEKVRIIILMICLLLLDTGVVLTRWVLYDEREEYASFLREYGEEIEWLRVENQRNLPPIFTAPQEKKLRKLNVSEVRPQGKEALKKLSWWYRGNLEHGPVWVDRSLKDLLSAYGGIYEGNVHAKSIYLTFDEGYENGLTGQILDVLRENQVKAAFFITGHYLLKNPDLVKRMVREGHIVGNHTVNHPAMWSLTEKDLCREVEELAREFKKLTGQEMAPFLRPPMGEFSPTSLWLTAKLGYYTVFWSFAYHDWDVKVQRGPDYAYQQVMKNYHPGAVLLLHAISRDNALALDKIIRDLRKEGYEFRTLYEIVEAE